MSVFQGELFFPRKGNNREEASGEMVVSHEDSSCTAPTRSTDGKYQDLCSAWSTRASISSCAWPMLRLSLDCWDAGHLHQCSGSPCGGAVWRKCAKSERKDLSALVLMEVVLWLELRVERVHRAAATSPRSNQWWARELQRRNKLQDMVGSYLSCRDDNP